MILFLKKIVMVIPIVSPLFPGYYGDMCSISCGHCQNTECDRSTGNCIDCSVGYHGN